MKDQSEIKGEIRPNKTHLGSLIWAFREQNVKERRREKGKEEEEEEEEERYGNYDFGMDYWTYGLLYGFLWMNLDISFFPF